MASSEPEEGLNSLVDISVEVEAAPPLRIRIGTVQPNRLVELRAGGVSLFIHATPPVSVENHETASLP